MFKKGKGEIEGKKGKEESCFIKESRLVHAEEMTDLKKMLFYKPKDVNDK